MVTTEELLKKNNVKSKLFQKIPYKPWESSFLIDEGKSAHEVDSNLITSPVSQEIKFRYQLFFNTSPTIKLIYYFYHLAYRYKKHNLRDLFS